MSGKPINIEPLIDKLKNIDQTFDHKNIDKTSDYDNSKLEYKTEFTKIAKEWVIILKNADSTSS